MLITAFVMIRNQSGTRATGALEFPRSSSEDRHVPLVFFRSPCRHSKRSARLQVLSKVFWDCMKNGFLEINHHVNDVPHTQGLLKTSRDSNAL